MGSLICSCAHAHTRVCSAEPVVPAVPRLRLPLAHTCTLSRHSPLADSVARPPVQAQEVISAVLPPPSSANDPPTRLTGVSPGCSPRGQADVRLGLRRLHCHRVSFSLLPRVLPVSPVLRAPPQALLLGGARVSLLPPPHTRVSCVAARVTSDSHTADLPGRLGRSGLLGCCSVAQPCPTPCNPVDCNTPGLPVLQCLPELPQTHVA